MVTQIFINLPVEPLPCQIAFFTAMGFEFDPVTPTRMPLA